MAIVMHTAGSNLSSNGMNLGRENQAASPMPDGSIMPNGMETTQPMMIAKKMEPILVMPFVKFVRPNVTANVMRPTIQFMALPKFSVPTPPAMYLMAVGYRLTPMVKMTVPVTSGGKIQRILS